MKKWLIGLLLIAGMADAEMPRVYAEKLGRIPKKCGLFLRFSGGSSFAEKAIIHAPEADWPPAPEGYNGTLGTRPFGEIAIGYEDDALVSGDLAVSYRPQYQYRKFQTPADAPAITREFDLDVLGVMASVYLSGSAYEELILPVGRSTILYPFVGGGVGVNQWRIYNFRSTGLPSSSFGAENQYAISYSTAYQVVAGLELRYGDHWALSLSYRWLSADPFLGPRFLRNPDGSAYDVGSNVWKIHYKANEAFLSLKVFL